MSATDEVIENLADAFCMLSKKPEHKALYVESLKSLARIAQAELVLQLQMPLAKDANGHVVMH